MKTGIFFLLTGVTLMPLLVTAQVPTILYQPIKYYESPDGTVLDNSKSVKPSSAFWVVWSDRSNNIVYNTPNGDASTQISTLNFLDKFYVTGEQGDYLELYKYEDGIKATGTGKPNQLNKKAKRVGWVKKENLLLWCRSLENPVSHFTEKVLTVVNERNISRTGEFVNKNADVKVFGSPDLQKENGNAVKMFQFLYVYKREGARVLIGKAHQSNFIKLEKGDVLGWVNEDILQKWNSRVCLEPNYDGDAAAKRKESNIKASLFFNQEEAQGWGEGTPTAKSLWSDDTYDQRWPAAKKRLPILEQNGNLVRTGFETPLLDENNHQVATVNDNAKVQGSSDAITHDYRKVNIVFVVDGGAGMDKYIAAIKASLQKLVNKIKENDNQGAEKNTYQYGAVVYRNQDDKNCPKGDLSLKKVRLTPSSDDVIGFLDRELHTEGCNSNSVNRDVNSALLEGLKMIKSVNVPNPQSNYMIIIGSATGNKGPELTTTPDIIANYGVNLSVFQVLNSSPDEFSNFSTNFVDLIRECKKRKYALDKKILKGDVKHREPDFKPIGSDVDNLYQLDYPTNSPFQGSLCFPEKNGSISAETIDNVLDTTFTSFENNIEEVLSKASTLVTGSGNNNIKFNAALQEYFERVGIKMGDIKLASAFTGKNYQFFEPAWAAVRINKLEEPVFKHVIYASEEDLTNMINKFNSTQIDASSAELREKVFDAYQTLVITYFGNDSRMNEAFRSKLTLDSVISKITGLPSRSPLLQDIKVDEIKDVNKVTDDQITAIQKAISDSIDKLNSCKADATGSMREVTDDGIFYWIPEDYLP